MTMNILAPLSRLAAVCAVALFAANPAAAAIMYGDFSDIPPGSVMYLDVEEDSPSGDTLPLYGAPEAVGDVLDFDPSGFGATSSNGDTPNPDITDGQLNFDFETIDGTGITSLLIEEGGDYKFFSGTTPTTSVNFDLIGEVMITEVNGVALPPAGIVVPFSANGSFSSTGTIPSTAWSLSVLVELGSALSGFGPGSVATAGEVFLNNTLIASSETGSLAFLAKKNFTITPDVQPSPDTIIPEPAAALLAVLAFTGLAARRR